MKKNERRSLRAPTIRVVCFVWTWLLKRLINKLEFVHWMKHFWPNNNLFTKKSNDWRKKGALWIEQRTYSSAGNCTTTMLCSQTFMDKSRVELKPFACKANVLPQTLYALDKFMSQWQNSCHNLVCIIRWWMFITLRVGKRKILCGLQYERALDVFQLICDFAKLKYFLCNNEKKVSMIIFFRLFNLFSKNSDELWYWICSNK